MIYSFVFILLVSIHISMLLNYLWSLLILQLVFFISNSVNFFGGIRCICGLSMVLFNFSSFAIFICFVDLVHLSSVSVSDFERVNADSVDEL